jgi:saccharopine dehydrogenase (NAD+, L-lysine-forming)
MPTSSSLSPHVWVRHETRSTERRAPVVPADVRRLVASGLRVTVEESPQRAFDIEEYAEAGASVAATGSWVDAPEDAWVLGIKELPDSPDELHHRHIYFAHSFKGQSDAVATLTRFEQGRGQLFDIADLTDDHGRRVVAFGYWAGYVGAALGVLELAGALDTPLAPTDQPTLDAQVRATGLDPVETLAVVTGARGRSGRGAVDALAVAGLAPMRWDRSESRTRDVSHLLGHDLLVNCVLTTVPATPFVTTDDLDRRRRLRLLADVTCDVTSDTNMLPVNTAITSWEAPVRRVTGREGGWMDVIAVDNLPSLLPREASVTFSADLTPHLLGLGDHPPVGPWAAAAKAYDDAVSRLP